MFLREEPAHTLTTVMDALDRPVEGIGLNAADIRVDRERQEIRLGDKRTVAWTEGSLSALGDFLQVPSAYLSRIDSTLKEVTLNHLCGRLPEEVVVRVSNATDLIENVRPTTQKWIDPRRIVEVASHVLTSDAPVVDWGNEGTFFLDTIVPAGFDRGIHGDRKVGDLTRGGLRFWMPLGKQVLAPQVQPYTYRLACTNGMETMVPGLKVDARGETVEEVLAELERQAEIAFSSVEHSISAFYELRSQQVENPERTLTRMAQEQRLSDRQRLHLVDAAPSILDEDGNASMFDLVNLITNQANDPTITQWGARRALQQFGGTIVTEHAARCGHCQAKLN